LEDTARGIPICPRAMTQRAMIDEDEDHGDDDDDDQLLLMEVVYRYRHKLLLAPLYSMTTTL
jgi:hypothetical protein